MPHKHSVYDTDKHFVIDPVTRTITSQTDKLKLMQGDHNSERFTFEVPRYIDGHDMSLCNRVEVHYINVGGNGTDISDGPYHAADLQISPDSEDVVIFSWLVSQNATKYAGSLNFAIAMKCLNSNVVDYSWRTEIFKGISVSTSIENDTYPVIEEYSDILAGWEERLFGTLEKCVMVTDQDLTEEEKTQARDNIGIARADMNQNNPEAPDYVLNRTHYEDPETGEVKKIDPKFLPEVGVKSWNDLEDRPFYETTEVVEKPLLIEWDGNIEGLQSGKLIITMSGQNQVQSLYRISEAAPAIDQIVGGTVVVAKSADGTTETLEISAQDAMALGNAGSFSTTFGFTVIHDPNEKFAQEVAPNTVAECVLEFPSAGVYTTDPAMMDGVWCASISLPNATMEVEETAIKTIDPKFLPDGVPYVEGEVKELLAETVYNFVHMDGAEQAQVDGLLGLVAGNKYKVVYNGEQYEYVAESLGVAEGTYLGNASVLGVENNGEPIGVIEVPSYNSWILVDYKGNASAIVSIKLDNLSVHKLDTRCLPDGVPYVESGVVEILPDYTITKENSDADMAGIPALGLVAGNTYIVTLNGVEYTCVAWVMTRDGITAVGLGDIYTASNGNLGTAATGEPFVLIEYPPEVAAEAGMTVMVQPLSEDIVLPVTFSIKGDVTTIHKLDNRCLDLEWLPTKEKTVKIEKMSVACSMNVDGAMCALIPSSAVIKQVISMAGQEVEFIVDGVSYMQTVKEQVIDRPETTYVEKSFYIGNGSLVSSSNENTGEPFYFTVSTSLDGDVAIFTCGAEPGVHTIEMYGDFKPNKLPAEFLPEVGVKSWNDMEDRPFYETKEVVEILPECQLEFNSDIGYPIHQVIEGVEVGKTYIVNFNGTEYECVAKNHSMENDSGEMLSTTVLGNLNILMDNALYDTGEPFVIETVPADVAETLGGINAVCMVENFSDELTLSIKGEQTTIKPIDPKYLPDTVATKDDITAAIFGAMEASY